jgi:hypothetical protein
MLFQQTIKINRSINLYLFFKFYDFLIKLIIYLAQINIYFLEKITNYEKFN